MHMINVRNVMIGLIASAVLAGIIVSCGGGSGGGGGPVTYSVGGTLSLATGTIVLKLIGGNNLSMANGPLTVTTQLADGAPYNVQVVDASDRCTVASGAGVMGTANVTNVAVTCGAQGAQKVIRSARLDGAQAGTTATGTGNGGVIVDPTTKAITGGITFSGLTGNPIGAHIHRADGTIAVGLQLASDNATGMVLNNIVLSTADYAELLAGTLYFNVHTVANAGGEIRGQINAQGGVFASVSTLDGTQEVDAQGNTTSTSTATGNGTMIVDAAPHADNVTHTVLITYIAHNVSNTSNAHIHTSVNANPPCAGGPTCNGPVILGFTNRTANVDGAGTNIAYPAAGSTVNQQNLPDFGLNYLYFNVHSTNNLCAPAANCGGGEI